MCVCIYIYIYIHILCAETTSFVNLVSNAPKCFSASRQRGTVLETAVCEDNNKSHILLQKRAVLITLSHLVYVLPEMLEA